MGLHNIDKKELIVIFRILRASGVNSIEDTKTAYPSVGPLNKARKLILSSLPNSRFAITVWHYMQMLIAYDFNYNQIEKDILNNTFHDFSSVTFVNMDVDETECGNCDGKGTVDCEDCGGSGEETCYNCNGHEEVHCETCEGSGTVYGDNDEEEECSECHGRGYEGCNTCLETGYLSCGECEGQGYDTCDNCDGGGEGPVHVKLNFKVVLIKNVDFTDTLRTYLEQEPHGLSWDKFTSMLDDDGIPYMETEYVEDDEVYGITEAEDAWYEYANKTGVEYNRRGMAQKYGRQHLFLNYEEDYLPSFGVSDVVYY